MADYSQLDKPEAAATPSGRGVTAVGRTGPFDVSSPSGTDWNQTFRQNRQYRLAFGNELVKNFWANQRGARWEHYSTAKSWRH